MGPLLSELEGRLLDARAQLDQLLRELRSGAKPGQVLGAYYEDPPLFTSEVRPAIGPGIRQCIGPMFDRVVEWAAAWSVGHASAAECNELGMSEAQRLVEDALDRYAEMDEPVGQVNCISLLADIAQERGDLTKARHLLEDALHRNIKLGLQLGHASCIQALAVVALRRGDLSEARRGLLDAEKKYANLGTIGGQVAGLWSMAELELAHRDFQLAASLYGEAAERSRAAGYKWFAWRCQLGLAEVAQARGDLDAAEAEYVVACAFFRSLPVQDGLREGDGLFGLAGIARQRASFDLAVDYCRQALECYRRCGATKKITNCERELTSLEATAATFQAGEADEH